MDQEIRNKLRNVVTRCRRLLEDDTRDALEGKFGIFAKKDHVTADPNAKMTHLSDEEQVARKDILDHFAHIKARGFKPKDALDQLVREIAFTHLNRLCAYKMMEAREVYVGGQKFREVVSRGVNSNGVKFYLAEHEEDERLYNTGHQDVAYRNFLDWLGGALSDEIGVLFNPNDPANRLYPRQKTLDEVLGLLNGGGIKPQETDLRQQWPQIWSQEEDETIGWVYQYFTPKELRDKARKESSTPRNSYELAFRNQFFTPRYVVEFLTDNTLGRIWYEMRNGDTSLKDQCRYMVRRPTEIFLKDGEQSPTDAAEGRDDLSQEELLTLPVHIPHRPKKDPRELKILDPACGSGHFLLYCFDLLLTIYEEAYADPDLGPALQGDYPKLEDLRRDVPRLILAHNLHGIDIDLRASQIAALALWLRCQRAYLEIGLKEDRPKIARSNFVCAEPMPGEEQMLKEFVGQLEPKLLGHVVEVVFEKMKLAGEAGSLLKIEEEIRDAVVAAKKQWVRETTRATDRKGKLLLFTQASMDRVAGKPEQPSLFDLSDITDDQFFDQAEANVIEALRSYAEKAQNSERLQRRLFTEDAVRGFAFVDLSQKRYDVILMNPPFGEPTTNVKALLDKRYDAWSNNLLCAFVLSSLDMLDGLGALGVIYDRTASAKTTYEGFRRSSLAKKGCLAAYADLGWGVLDANVETAVATLTNIDYPCTLTACYDLRSTHVDNRGTELLSAIRSGLGRTIRNVVFDGLPNAIIGYDFPDFLIAAFNDVSCLEQAGFRAYGGHSLKAEVHNRVWWEYSLRCPPLFVRTMFNGSGFAPFTTAFREVVISNCELYELPRDSATVLRNREVHGRPGCCYAKRADVFSAHVAPCDMIFTQEGRPLPVANQTFALGMLGFLNTTLFRLGLNKLCGQHKASGYVNMFPFREDVDLESLHGVVEEVLSLATEIRILDETQRYYMATADWIMEGIGKAASWLCEKLNQYATQIANTERSCGEIVKKVYQPSLADEEELEAFRRQLPRVELPFDNLKSTNDMCYNVAECILSQAVGSTLGRWDIRLATGERQRPELPEPFAPLPVCPPGMLQGSDGLPARPEDVPPDYPIRIVWDGVLVDDMEHSDDIVRRVRESLEVILKDRAAAIEMEACEILGVKGLREYFRKSGKGGFWDDHVSRLSKSRRKAPIYWLLQSSKKNYAIWVYYHRLDKDLLFKALVNYVEPKIRLESSCLDTLCGQKSTAGDTGKEAKGLAKKIEKQEDFLSELRDFEDKLRRAANLHLEPDLNDGVVLSIAPLHELVPWKVAKKYWEELLAGKYEWSSIGKQLRQKGLVK